MIEVADRARMVGKPSRPVKNDRKVATKAKLVANTGTQAIWRMNKRNDVITVSFLVGGCTTPSNADRLFVFMLLY